MKSRQADLSTSMGYQEEDPNKSTQNDIDTLLVAVETQKMKEEEYQQEISQLSRRVKDLELELEAVPSKIT